MQVLESKGATIKAWTNIDAIEAEALRQLYRVAHLPFIYKHVAVMPDVHAGVGATVGSVIATQEALIPSAVGVDIGCGMLAVKTNLNFKDLPKDLTQLRLDIEKAIPLWFSAHDTIKYGEDLEFEKLSVYKSLSKDSIYKALTQVGSLGGGNHFIELTLDEDKNVWIMLHSGSRNVGNTVASIYIKKAKQQVLKKAIKLEDANLSYFTNDTEEFFNYMNDAMWCQEYALKNRQTMLQLILKVLKKHFKKIRLVEDIISCHHNYIAIENHFGDNIYVTRKGAIRAKEDDFGIIPGSMGAKSYIVKGKGNPESFTSCSHGAGRKMSRSEAKRRFTVSDLKRETQGIECQKTSNVLDEIPSAYKDIDFVMEEQKELVEIVTTLKQIICIKG